jgi:hypothetical protein
MLNYETDVWGCHPLLHHLNASDLGTKNLIQLCPQSRVPVQGQEYMSPCLLIIIAFTIGMFSRCS